jgi:thiol-disulfide isomerase/thioredoxin
MLLGLIAATAVGCGSRDPIAAHRGEWLFINYWATWCKPCIREVPELNALDGLEGFAVLGINYDGEQGEELRAQETRLAIAFPTLANDPAARFGVERPQVLPTTLVIDPRGSLHRVLIGPQTLESLRAATESGEEQR